MAFFSSYKSGCRRTNSLWAIPLLYTVYNASKLYAVWGWAQSGPPIDVPLNRLLLTLVWINTPCD